jgi:hypothetical protein
MRPWQVTVGRNGLDCRVDSQLCPGLSFRRRMTFSRRGLRWDFALANVSNNDVPFLHVMHPLMPPSRVAGLHLPAFDSACGESSKRRTSVAHPVAVAQALLDVPEGESRSWLLRGLRAGRCGIDFRDGPRLTVTFDRTMFPSLAIWWNRRRYPEGAVRDEFAIEPLPGTHSSLAKSVKNGQFLLARAGQTLRWRVTWRVR